MGDPYVTAVRAPRRSPGSAGVRPRRAWPAPALAASAIGALLLAAACASTPSGTQRGTTNVITREELGRLDVTNAYEAVERLRPHFLRGRGPTSLRNPQVALPMVYVAGVKLGGPEALQRVLVGQVMEIRYLSASDATTRYGTDHTGGAIIVMLR